MRHKFDIESIDWSKSSNELAKETGYTPHYIRFLRKIYTNSKIDGRKINKQKPMPSNFIPIYEVNESKTKKKYKASDETIKRWIDEFHSNLIKINNK